MSDLIVMEESLRRLKTKVKNELIIYYCLKSHHRFELKIEKLESRMKTMILNIGFIFMWSWFTLLVIFTGNLCQGKRREKKPLMDCYKFLHFSYDLSNLWHFLSLQSAFLFTSRDGLNQNVKRLWERKDLHISQLNSRQKTLWALQTWAELNY